MYNGASLFFDTFYGRLFSKEPTGCWHWHGRTTNKRYGRIMIKGKVMAVHRLVYLLFKGDPKGLHVLHRCDNPMCVNPEHLFLGTHKDNMRDREAKGRANHPKGETHKNAKLTRAQVNNILADKRKCPEIAKDYPVSVHHIRHIKAGTEWRT